MTEDENGMKKKPNRKRPIQLNFRVTEIEKERIETEAEAAEMDLGDYIRDCALKNSIVHLNPKEFTTISQNLISIARTIEEVGNRERTDEDDMKYEDLKELVEDMQGVIFKTVSDIYDKYL